MINSEQFYLKIRTEADRILIKQLLSYSDDSIIREVLIIMKKRLFIFFCLVIFLFNIGLAEQNNLILLEGKSQIILDNDIVILVIPSEETVYKLKIKMGDNFYIMADDANYYLSLVYNYLISINQPYLIKQDNEAIFYFQENGSLHKIQNSNSNLHWWALLYKHNEGKYKIIELSNFEDNYKKFIALGQTDSIKK